VLRDVTAMSSFRKLMLYIEWRTYKQTCDFHSCDKFGSRERHFYQDCILNMDANARNSEGLI